MKSAIYLKGLFLLLTCFTLNSYGQQTEPAKSKEQTELQKQRMQQNFYRRTLQVDSVKASQVAKIQASYKEALNAIVADTTLNDTARRVRIKAIMGLKNRQLEQLLTPAQQAKIIPTTERQPAEESNQP